VVSTVTHLCDRIVFLTAVTPNKIKIAPNFPVYFLPTDSEGFPYESNELLQVPVPVNHVLSAHLSVSINALLAVAACEDLALLLREELAAVGTLMQVILLLLEK
jgi:hypothetical protein